jgi:hypothetical protein
VHGSNARNLSVQLSLSQTSSNAIIIVYVFSSTKSENKSVEHVLPESSGVGEKVAQIVYKHVNKCKIDKIEFKNTKLKKIGHSGKSKSNSSFTTHS